MTLEFIEAMHRYDPDGYGAAWLRSHHKTVHPQMERVAALVHWLFDGIYHEDASVLKADWSGDYLVHFSISSALATWDSAQLTRLVMGAHELCIRVEVRPCGLQRVSLWFWPRDTRVGSIFERHPTLEQAIESFRPKSLCFT